MGLDWLSPVVGALGDFWSTNEANSSNAEALNQQMAFNREVMQNRHQWEVEDLKKAGLNPLMSTTSPTGTLSAPNSSPANKANFAQSALALAQINVANKTAEAQLNSSKADLQNADTNRLNAQTNANELQETIRNNRALYELSSQEVRQAWSRLSMDKELNNANVSFVQAQTFEQNVKNQFAYILQQRNLDEIEQRIALAALLAQGQLELMEKQGNAAMISANAQAVSAEAARIVGLSQADLNNANIDTVRFELEKSKERWTGEAPLRQRQAFENEFDLNYRKTFVGTTSYTFGRILEDMTKGLGFGARSGNFNVHSN